MDKIRKIGQWIWYNKERTVLGVMILLFSWRVYEVISPQPPEETDSYRIPGSIAPEGPPPPPAASGYSPEVDARTLMEQNPWWVYAASSQGTSGGRTGEENPGIRLLDIQKLADGSYSARLWTTTRRWYKVGEQFESFRLEKIDSEARSADVYCEKLGKVVQLRVQR